MIVATRGTGNASFSRAWQAGGSRRHRVTLAILLAAGALCAGGRCSPAAAAPATASATAVRTEAERVAVEVDGCGTILSSSELEDALGVELRGADERVSGYIERLRPSVRVRCAAGQITVEVIADDGVALRESMRAVRLGLARFVAIAVAESVAARASAAATATTAPRPSSLPAAAAPTALASPAATIASSAWPGAPASPAALAAWLWLGGLSSWGGSPAWWSRGAAIGADVTVRSRITLHLDVGAATGGLDVDAGHLDAFQPSGAVGARIGGSVGWFRAEAGAAVRAGAVIWKGRAGRPDVTGRTDTAPFMGPAIDIVLGFDVARRVRLRLHAEAGFPLATASAEGLGLRYARLDPGWLQGAIELGFRVTDDRRQHLADHLATRPSTVETNH